MKGGSAATGGSMLSRIVKAPLRALRRARDLYVSGMTGCAGRVAMAGYPSGGASGIPRSYSVASRASNSSEDDMRELIRAASQGAMGSLNLGGATGLGPQLSPGKVPRSQSVAIGRIDEDKPCDFGGDFAMVGRPLYPRSRSCAVAKRMVGVIA